MLVPDKKEYVCSWCKKSIFDGRANYTIKKWGVPLCGSKKNGKYGSYCEMFEAEKQQKKNHGKTANT